MASERGVCLLEFDGPRLAAQLRRVEARLGAAAHAGKSRHLDRLGRELRAYFGGGLRRFRVPLVLAGTPFQVAVWRRLLRVPYGATFTYDRLARSLGRPGAQRAVGRANGDNPLAIVVPCHRLVGADGNLRGYGGGTWRKRRLLEIEGALALPS